MRSLVTAVLVCLLALVGPARADTKTQKTQTVELRIATLAPGDSGWMKLLNKTADQIRKATKQRVTIAYDADGTQGDERDVIRKINLGQLDGAVITSVGLAMIDESIRVLELPMMFDSVAELDYVAEKMWPYFQAEFEKEGYVLLERGDIGWIYFFSKKEVKSLSDLKNQKVWMWADDQVVTATYKTLKISGVPFGVPDVDRALTSGRINACYSSPMAALAFGWTPPELEYMTSMPLAYAIGATVVKKTSMDKLGDADREQVEKLSRAGAKKLRKQVRKDNVAAVKQLKRMGLTIVDSPNDMVEEFRKAAERTWQALVGKVYTQAELDEVLRLRDEYRARGSD